MSTVQLDEQEWQQVMAIISTAPWRDANPLLMKIGGQLRAAQDANTEKMRQIYNAELAGSVHGNGKETAHE